MLEFNKNLATEYVKSSSEALIIFFSKQVNVAVTILKNILNAPCSSVLLINDKAVNFV
jgi:hypothetical protein